MAMEHKGLNICLMLENLAKCPICMNRLSGDIAVCEAGHSVCRLCTYNIPPGCMYTTCRRPYTAMNNLLAQELLSLLDVIKVNLMELDLAKFKLNNKQNCDESINNNSNKNELQPGQYRCWMKNDCKFVGYASRMIGHFRNCHPLEFNNCNGNLPYTQNWQMNYFGGNNLNRAFNITNVGLFILLIFKNDNDDLNACVLMYAPAAFQHSYKIEIECDEKKLLYNGQADSARTPKHIIFRSGRKGLLIDRNEPLYIALKEKSRFKCSVTIDKNINTPITTEPNSLNSKKEDYQQQEKKINSATTTESNSNNSKNEDNQQHGKKRNKKHGNANNNRDINKQQLNCDLKINDKQQNQSKTNNTSYKQSTESKASVSIDTELSSSSKNQLNISDNTANSSTGVSKSVAQPLHINKKLSKSQLYPNLDTYKITQGSSVTSNPLSVKHDVVYQRNTNPHGTPQMINNHFTNVNAPSPFPSAPYETPPPRNPFFDEPKPNHSTRNVNYSSKNTTKSKNMNDACVLF